MPKDRFAITVDTRLHRVDGGPTDRQYVMECILMALQRGDLDVLLNEDNYDVRVVLTDTARDNLKLGLTMLGRNAKD